MKIPKPQAPPLEAYEEAVIARLQRARCKKRPAAKTADLKNPPHGYGDSGICRYCGYVRTEDDIA